MKTFFKFSALALAVLLSGAGVTGWAQQRGEQMEEMSEHCRQMMERHQAMQQRMQQMDRELE